MKNAIKYIYPASPFYVHWKKHACPKCNIYILSGNEEIRKKQAEIIIYRRAQNIGARLS